MPSISVRLMREPVTSTLSSDVVVLPVASCATASDGSNAAVTAQAMLLRFSEILISPPRNVSAAHALHATAEEDAMAPLPWS